MNLKALGLLAITCLAQAQFAQASLECTNKSEEHRFVKVFISHGYAMVQTTAGEKAYGFHMDITNVNTPYSYLISRETNGPIIDLATEEMNKGTQRWTDGQIRAGGAQLPIEIHCVVSPEKSVEQASRRFFLGQ